jgi:putative FmdB family regulatory protein
MPLYEFQCQNCGAHFDTLRNFSDDDRDVECPECHEKTCERLISLTASDMLRAMSSSCGGNRRGPSRFG